MVTLMRAFNRTVTTMGEIEGQLLCNLSYSFILVPIDSDVTYAELVKKQDALAVGVISSRSVVAPEYSVENRSFMKIEGDGITLSIVKQPEEAGENSIIVRVYNASEKNTEGKICFERSIKEVYETNLNEDVKGSVKADNNSVPVMLSPWKIATYKIVFE